MKTSGATGRRDHIPAKMEVHCQNKGANGTKGNLKKIRERQHRKIC